MKKFKQNDKEQWEVWKGVRKQACPAPKVFEDKKKAFHKKRWNRKDIDNGEKE